MINVLSEFLGPEIQIWGLFTLMPITQNTYILTEKEWAYFYFFLKTKESMSFMKRFSKTGWSEVEKLDTSMSNF